MDNTEDKPDRIHATPASTRDAQSIPAHRRAAFTSGKILRRSHVPVPTNPLSAVWVDEDFSTRSKVPVPANPLSVVGVDENAVTTDRSPTILSCPNVTADQQKYRTPPRFPPLISPGDIALRHTVPQPLRFHYPHRMKKNRIDPDPGPAHPDNPYSFTGRQRRQGSADRSHCTCSALPHRSVLQSLWAEETQTHSPGSSHPAQCNASSSDPVT